VFKLVAKRSTGDSPCSFDSLFETHHLAIYRYCVRRLGVADAQDAAAEVFAVAWRRIGDVPDGEGSRAWLYSVARRVVSNQYRGRVRRSNLSRRLEGAVRSSHEISGKSPGGDPDFEMLYKALGQLSSTDRELLTLSYWDALTRTEIALVLQISENAVDQRLFRARKRLEKKLGRIGTQTGLGHEEAPE
jgi:RNA polymerase sigma factor (sigma-70 family)